MKKLVLEKLISSKSSCFGCWRARFSATSGRYLLIAKNEIHDWLAVKMRIQGVLGSFGRQFEIEEAKLREASL